MEKLHIHPTPTSQWQALIDEAQQTLSLSLGEELESYLVFLLMRFTTAQKMDSHFIATEWLHSLNQFGQKRQESLRDVGDHCLIFSGLFPGIARKRHVPIGYYVNIGKSAYYTLSEEKHSSLSSLFLHLHEDFVSLMDVLHSTREIGEHENLSLDLIQAEELWHQTGSFHAKQTLESRLNQDIRNLHPPQSPTAH